VGFVLGFSSSMSRHVIESEHLMATWMEIKTDNPEALSKGSFSWGEGSEISMTLAILFQAPGGQGVSCGSDGWRLFSISWLHPTGHAAGAAYKSSKSQFLSTRASRQQKRTNNRMNAGYEAPADKTLGDLRLPQQGR